MKDDQIARIRAMEQALNEGIGAVRALEEALERYESVLPELKMLAEYYVGPLWMADFDDDRRGKFPGGLPRGVLSEDALYNLLCDHDRLRATMKKLSGPEREM